MICKARCFKPASASNEAFLKAYVKQYAPNQIQPPRNTFLNCTGKSFKPDPASNEAFLKGSVKQDASNQLQPQMKPFLKDL